MHRTASFPYSWTNGAARLGRAKYRTELHVADATCSGTRIKPAPGGGRRNDSWTKSSESQYDTSALNERVQMYGQ
ncbi:MAG TPA: hypothetical protein VN844_04960 [Pyrinomonadaceae bacterium]|nr:hypothetical protein [Pyrinomonadaceae bacterium]